MQPDSLRGVQMLCGKAPVWESIRFHFPLFDRGLFAVAFGSLERSNIPWWDKHTYLLYHDFKSTDIGEKGLWKIHGTKNNWANIFSLHDIIMMAKW